MARVSSRRLQLRDLQGGVGPGPAPGPGGAGAVVAPRTIPAAIVVVVVASDDSDGDNDDEDAAFEAAENLKMPWTRRKRLMQCCALALPLICTS